jgi:hypothetical protein
MFFLLPLAVLSWKEQMMALAAEIGFQQFGYSKLQQILKVLENAGDDFERVSQAAAWMYYAEKPPFNIKSFNHWHFCGTPLNYSSIEIHQHVDEDNVIANLDSIKATLKNMKNQRTWPFSFSLKLYLSSLCDIFSPLHLSELFSETFPNGDRNGRDFYVKMNGEYISLYDAWESGCGYFSNSVNFNNKDTWTTIDKLKDAITLEFHQFDYMSYADVEEETYNFTRDFV